VKDDAATVPASWPLQDIVITNIVWCMAYRREAWGGSFIAQYSCNSTATVWVGNADADGEGQEKYDSLVQKKTLK